MEELTDWIRRRSATISLSALLLFWYVIQLIVLVYYGEETATRWFYFEHTRSGFPIISPGVLLAPISHELDDLTHIGANLLLLLTAGGFVEPYIKKRQIGILVLGFGYLGMYLANATAVIHGFWNVSGTSIGILSLWAFAGLEKKEMVFWNAQVESLLSSEFVESFVATVLLISTPFILISETVMGLHSGHAMGILLGGFYYAYEALT
jgi:hypothetical protein